MYRCSGLLYLKWYIYRFYDIEESSFNPNHINGLPVIMQSARLASNICIWDFSRSLGWEFWRGSENSFLNLKNLIIGNVHERKLTTNPTRTHHFSICLTYEVFTMLLALQCNQRPGECLVNTFPTHMQPELSRLYAFLIYPSLSIDTEGLNSI